MVRRVEVQPDDVAHFLDEEVLSARGVGLRVLAGQGAQIDTTTAAGRLVFGIFAALAGFERELIRNAGYFAERGATCKTLEVAAQLSPPILRVNTALSWNSTACSGREGPTASQDAENKGIDVFVTERRDTGG